MLAPRACEVSVAFVLKFHHRWFRNKASLVCTRCPSYSLEHLKQLEYTLSMYFRKNASTFTKEIISLKNLALTFATE